MRRNKPLRLFPIVNTLVLGVCLLLAVLPFLHLAALSISSKPNVMANAVFFWPKGIHFENYSVIFGSSVFLRTVYNSLVRVFLGVIVNIGLVVLTAYPLAIGERKLRGRNLFLVFFFFTMLFNGGMIPNFLLVRDLGLINSVWSLILPGAVQVFGVIIMINYMRGIPNELYEAAVLDGAGHFIVLLRIFLPLSIPCLATLVMFSAVSHWNSWFDGMLYMKTPARWPLQTYLQSILVDLQSLSQKIGMSPEEAQRYAKISDLSLLSAQMFISIIPVLILYPFMQRYFINGIRLGAVKG